MSLEKGITIFTPTYNRAYCISKLYESLCAQTNKCFQWIVVDDGSTDNTAELFKQWQADGVIPIIYFHQPNSGKPSAHNKGVELAERELFTCVDSDDYLNDDAVEIILQQWEEQHGAIGLLNNRITNTGESITRIDKGVVYTTLDGAYRKYHMIGDTMLVYDTAVIRQHRFPVFENEKFIPENYLYDQLDQCGELYVGNRNLYVCEYREDGYTASIHRLNANNPRGYEAYMLQRLRFDRSIREKLSDTIRYISIKKVIAEGRILKDSIYPVLTIACFVPGIIRYNMLYRQYVK